MALNPIKPTIYKPTFIHKKVNPMKINTKKMSYEEVLKLPRLKHKKPLKPQMWLAAIVRIVVDLPCVKSNSATPPNVWTLLATSLVLY